MSLKIKNLYRVTPTALVLAVDPAFISNMLCFAPSIANNLAKGKENWRSLTASFVSLSKVEYIYFFSSLVAFEVELDLLSASYTF